MNENENKEIKEVEVKDLAETVKVVVEITEEDILDVLNKEIGVSADEEDTVVEVE